MVYEFYFSLYDVDIKVKSHFLPKPNLTRKIEFMSKEVQIVEPEIFGLLMLRIGWNFGSILFDVQTAAERWVRSPVTYSLYV